MQWQCSASAGNRWRFRNSVISTPSDTTLLRWRMLNRLPGLRFVEEFDGGFEYFVFAGGDGGDGGLDADVGLNADALELAAVGVADVHAGETGDDAARHRSNGHVPIGARG